MHPATDSRGSPPFIFFFKTVPHTAGTRLDIPRELRRRELGMPQRQWRRLRRCRRLLLPCPLLSLTTTLLPLPATPRSSPPVCVCVCVCVCLCVCVVCVVVLILLLLLLLLLHTHTHTHYYICIYVASLRSRGNLLGTALITAFTKLFSSCYDML